MSTRLIGDVHRLPALRLLDKLDNDSVAAIILDPPERLGVHTSGESTVAHSVLDTLIPIAQLCSLALVPGGAVIIMGGHNILSAFDIVAESNDFRLSAEIVVLWIYERKSRPTNGLVSLHMPVRWYRKPGHRAATSHELRLDSNVVIAHAVKDAHIKNPAQKPVELFNYLISALTLDRDLIVDPFCGAGSSLVAAEMCNRRWIGGDSDGKQVVIAQRRVHDLEKEDSRMAVLETWAQGRKKRIEG